MVIEKRLVVAQTSGGRWGLPSKELEGPFWGGGSVQHSVMMVSWSCTLIKTY